MGIIEEKEEIVERIYDEVDVSVIHAIKDLMDTIHGRVSHMKKFGQR